METTIVCAGTLGFFVILFGFILLWRFINYRETLALAEKGLVRPSRERNGQGRATLVWGILIAAVGLALTVSLWPLGVANFGANDYPLGFGPWMMVGLLPLFFGLALVLVYILTRNGKHPETTGTAEQYPLPSDENQ